MLASLTFGPSLGMNGRQSQAFSQTKVKLYLNKTDRQNRPFLLFPMSTHAHTLVSGRSSSGQVSGTISAGSLTHMPRQHKAGGCCFQRPAQSNLCCAVKTDGAQMLKQNEYRAPSPKKSPIFCRRPGVSANPSTVA